MKKKILMTVTAVTMALAMSASAMAAPIVRGTGNVDGNSVVDSNDASTIHKNAIVENDLDEGNFDGDWRNRDSHMDTVDASRVLGYVLQPENYTEKIGLRFYSNSSTAISNGAPKFFVDSEVNSPKSNWEGTYENSDSEFLADSNLTIDEAVRSIASNDNAGWTSEANEAFSKYLGGIFFIGDGDTYGGQRVCLTTEEGWLIFNHAMRGIVPVDAETLEQYAPSRLEYDNPRWENTAEVYKTLDGIYTTTAEMAELYPDLPTFDELDAATQARVNAFNELKSYIVSGVDYQTNIDVNDPMVMANMYDAFSRAFASDDMTEQMVRDTADRFAWIYTRRYTITTSTQNGAGDNFIEGDNPGGNSVFVEKICENRLYDYNTATLQDVRDTFGDQITIETAKKNPEDSGDIADGYQWSFTLEFYERYVEK